MDAPVIIMAFDAQRAALRLDYKRIILAHSGVCSSGFSLSCAPFEAIMRFVGFVALQEPSILLQKAPPGQARMPDLLFYGDLVCVVSLPELRPRKRKEGN